jgi:hypothetical protein
MGDPALDDPKYQSFGKLFVELGGFSPVVKRRRHLKNKGRQINSINRVEGGGPCRPGHHRDTALLSCEAIE